jgi:hypothetical protein
MPDFPFRRNDGSTFTVQATDVAQARVIAQAQHDQAEADKRRAVQPATKQGFIDAYRARLLATYTWTSNAAKFERYMASVQETLNGANGWNHRGEAVTAAWRDIGFKGQPTLKGLRALP